MIDGLTLDQLRVFVTVAQAGSFSAAGRYLGRAQSSISQMILALEGQLAVSLFDRAGKFLQLTDAGRSVLVMAQDVIVRTDDLRAHAALISQGVEAELVIAIDCVFPTAPLAASLRSVLDHFPGLPLTLHTEVIGAAEQRLRDGTAQIGLYPYMFGSTQGLEAAPLIDVPVIPVVACSHALASDPCARSRRDLEAHTQLILTDGSPRGVTGGRAVISPKNWRFADLGRRIDFLLAGFGWALMPLHLVAEHVTGGRLFEIELADQNILPRAIPIHAVYASGNPPGLAGQWLLDDLAERLTDTRCFDAVLDEQSAGGERPE